MPANPIKTKLAEGKTVFGIWSIIPSPHIAEIVGNAGFDFQIFDREHGVFDLETLDACIRACEGAGCAPLVRSPGLDKHFIQSVLDVGAYGIVVPQIAGADEARAAVRMMKYGPKGVRGYHPFTRAAHYGMPGQLDNSKQQDDFVFTSVIVETLPAFEELDRILGTPELDMVYLGVYDLSVALGCPGRTDDPGIVQFVEVCVAKIRAAGKAVMVMAKNQADIERLLALGTNMIVFAVDTFVIGQALNAAVQAFRAAGEKRR